VAQFDDGETDAQNFVTTADAHRIQASLEGLRDARASDLARDRPDSRATPHVAVAAGS